jgi:hypothetical protein
VLRRGAGKDGADDDGAALEVELAEELANTARQVAVTERAARARVAEEAKQQQQGQQQPPSSSSASSGGGDDDDFQPLKFDADLTVDGYDYPLLEVTAASAVVPALLGAAASAGALDDIAAQPELRQLASVAAPAAGAVAAVAAAPAAAAPQPPLPARDPATLLIDVAAYAATGEAALALQSREAAGAASARRSGGGVRVRGAGSAPAATATASTSAPGGGALAVPSAFLADSPAAAAARALAGKTPSALSQYGAALREETDYERCLTALATLPRAVRAAAARESAHGSLTLDGPLLLRTLMGLEDRFALPQFHLWRHTGLVALTVALGPAGSHALLGMLWGPDLSAATRMEAVDVLVGAAREMCGAEPAAVPVPPWEEDEAAAAAAAAAPAPRQTPATAAAAAAAGGNEPPPPAGGPDVFTDVAVDWFFGPLLRGVVTGRPFGHLPPRGRQTGFSDGDSGMLRESLPPDVADSLSGASAARLHSEPGALLDAGNSSSGGGDGSGSVADGRTALLAHALRALAVLLECVASGAGNSSSTARSRALVPMARSLLPLAWSVRSHADAGVRRAAISCFASVVAGLHRLGPAGCSQALASPSTLGPQQAAVAAAARSGDLPAPPQSPLVQVVVGSDGSGDGAGAAGSGRLGTLSSLLRVSSALSQTTVQDSILGQLTGAGADGTLSSTSVLLQLGRPTPSSGDGPLGGSSARAHALLGEAAGVLLGQQAGAGAATAAAGGGGDGGALDAATAAALMSAPLVLDDVLAVAAHLRDVAEGDADDVCRALAGAMLRNDILRRMVLGPEEDE